MYSVPSFLTQVLAQARLALERLHTALPAGTDTMDDWNIASGFMRFFSVVHAPRTRHNRLVYQFEKSMAAMQPRHVKPQVGV